MTAPPVDQATAYMERHEWSLFPVSGKKPLKYSNGVLDASRDPGTASIWQHRPDLGIALATGDPSGVWVLDVDGEKGLASLHRLEAEHGALPQTVTSRTGNGSHLFFQTVEGVDISNSAGKVAPGIDIRGTGGYAVLPESPHPDGPRYSWLLGHSPDDVPVAIAPGWLVELATRPKRRRVRLTPPPVDGDITAPRYVAAAIEAECLELAITPEGARNDRLNRAAYALARFVVGGQADAGAVVRVLQLAAAHAGLDEREVDRTIRSAFRAREVGP